MKVVFNTGTITAELEGKDQQELFEEIARFQEVFGDLECSAVIDGELHTSDKVVFRVRTDSEENKYYELMCIDNGPLRFYKKIFGCHKKGGGLFPKKQEGDNLVQGRNYWAKFVKES